MKRVGDLMKELGFNPEASEGAKKAFIKHLIRESEGAPVVSIAEAKPQKPQAPAQLSFDFDATGTEEARKK